MKKEKDTIFRRFNGFEVIRSNLLTLGEFRKLTKDIPDDFNIEIYWDSDFRGGLVCIDKKSKLIVFGESEL